MSIFYIILYIVFERKTLHKHYTEPIKNKMLNILIKPQESNTYIQKKKTFEINKLNKSY